MTYANVCPYEYTLTIKDNKSSCTNFYKIIGTES